jgi:hypothetical protein
MQETLVAGAVIGTFALLLFLLERFTPLRSLKRPLLGRLVVNLSFAAVAFVTVSLTVRPAAKALLGSGPSTRPPPSPG